MKKRQFYCLWILIGITLFCSFYMTIGLHQYSNLQKQTKNDHLAILSHIATQTIHPKKEKVILGIGDEHNHALYFWVKAVQENKIPRNGKGLPLLHFDAHSDAEAASSIRFVKNITNGAPIDVQALIKNSGISDFITMGQFMRIVGGDVVFVKPDWKKQPFNAPNGLHHVILGRERNSSYLCYYMPKNSKGYSKGFYEEYVEDNECKKQLEEAINVRWLVKPISKSFSEIPKLIPPNSQYILDIDEDFFAAMDPGLDNFLKPEKFMKYFDVLEQFFTEKELCLGKTKKEIKKNEKKINNLLFSMFWEEMIFVDGYSVPLTPKDYKGKFDKSVLKLWCKGTDYALEQLRKLSKFVYLFLRNLSFEKLAFLKMSYNFPDIKCRLNDFFGVCSAGNPVYEPSEKEFEESFQKMEQILRRQGPPAVISVARSTVGYVFKHWGPKIERKLIDLLYRVFGDLVDLQLEYYPNLSPFPNGDPVKYKPPQKEIDKLMEKIQRIQSDELRKNRLLMSNILYKVHALDYFAEKNEMDHEDLFLEENLKLFYEWFNNLDKFDALV